MKIAVVCLLVCACGGDEGGGEADAGADAPATVSGGSAMQVYQSAWTMAKAEATDAILTQIRGEVLVADTGEVDPELQGSYWTLNFESESTDQLISVLYSRGTLTVTPGLSRPHLKPIMTEWKDSTETVTTLKANGYTPPSAPPPEYVVTMDLSIFTTDNMDDPRYGVNEPFWHLTVVHDPATGTPMTETNLWAVYVVANGGWLICNYLTGECTNV